LCEQKARLASGRAGHRFQLNAITTAKFTGRPPGAAIEPAAPGRRPSDGRLAVEFAGEADCVLTSGNRYRVVNIRPGKVRFKE
jgi:hypothetical protein